MNLLILTQKLIRYLSSAVPADVADSIMKKKHDLSSAINKLGYVLKPYSEVFSQLLKLGAISNGAEALRYLLTLFFHRREIEIKRANVLLALLSVVSCIGLNVSTNRYIFGLLVLLSYATWFRSRDHSVLQTFVNSNVVAERIVSMDPVPINMQARSDSQMREMAKHVPQKPNAPILIKRVRKCPVHEVPLWMHGFEFAECENYYCECGRKHFHLYSDLVGRHCVLSSLGNIVLIDRRGVPNHTFNPCKVMVRSPVSSEIPSLGSFVVDLSEVLNCTRVVAAPSSQNFRSDYRVQLDNKGVAYTLEKSFEYGFVLHFINRVQSYGSISLNQGEWKGVFVYDFEVISDFVECAPPPMELIEGFDPKDFSTPDDGRGLPPNSDSELEVLADELINELPLRPPLLSNPTNSSSKLDEKEEEVEVEFIDAVKSSFLQNEICEQLTNISLTITERGDMRPEADEEQSDPHGFIKGDVKCFPGCSLWEDKPVLSLENKNVEILSFDPNKTKVKTECLYVAQNFGTLVPIHFPNTSQNTWNACQGRLAKNIRTSFKAVTIGAQRFVRPLSNFLDRLLPSNGIDVSDIDADFKSIWENEPTLRILMTNLKAASKARLCEWISRVTLMECSWEEAVGKFQLKPFPLFCKSDDKIFKPKSRIIQFVPSIYWLRFIIKLNAVLDQIKSGDYWSIKGFNCDYVWASGMTQRQLGEACTYARNAFNESQRQVVLICGDDNTAIDGDADGTQFDSSQRGWITEVQRSMLASIGFSKKEIEVIFSTHKGKREFCGIRIDLKYECLPSGAPWTLFLNTLTLIIFREVLGSITKIQSDDMVTAYEAASKICGLDMKFNPSANLLDNPFNGSEFLKGVIIDVGSRLVWVPLPTRMVKWTALIVRQGKRDKRQMAAHLASVAVAQDPFLLPPLCRVWVERWKAHNNPINYSGFDDWQNVLPDSRDCSGEALSPEETTVFNQFWTVFFSTRYNVDERTYAALVDLVQTNALNFGRFTGPSWDRMVARDYLGTVPIP